jgi:hypothetical protein
MFTALKFVDYGSMPLLNAIFSNLIVLNYPQVLTPLTPLFHCPDLAAGSV